MTETAGLGFLGSPVLKTMLAEISSRLDARRAASSVLSRNRSGTPYARANLRLSALGVNGLRAHADRRFVRRSTPPTRRNGSEL